MTYERITGQSLALNHHYQLLLVELPRFAHPSRVSSVCHSLIRVFSPSQDLPDTLDCSIPQETDAIPPEEREELKVSGAHSALTQTHSSVGARGEGDVHSTGFDLPHALPFSISEAVPV